MPYEYLGHCGKKNCKADFRCEACGEVVTEDVEKPESAELFDRKNRDKHDIVCPSE